MKPLYSHCTVCKDAPSHVTRQRQLGRRFQPKWHLACMAHAPATNDFHETITLAEYQTCLAWDTGEHRCYGPCDNPIHAGSCAS